MYKWWANRMVFAEAQFIFLKVGRFEVIIQQFSGTVATEDDAIFLNVILDRFRAESGKFAFFAEAISGNTS